MGGSPTTTPRFAGRRRPRLRSCGFVQQPRARVVAQNPRVFPIRSGFLANNFPVFPDYPWLPGGVMSSHWPRLERKTACQRPSRIAASTERDSLVLPWGVSSGWYLTLHPNRWEAPFQRQEMATRRAGHDQRLPPFLFPPVCPLQHVGAGVGMPAEGCAAVFF